MEIQGNPSPWMLGVRFVVASMSVFTIGVVVTSPLFGHYEFAALFAVSFILLFGMGLVLELVDGSWHRT